MGIIASLKRVKRSIFTSRKDVCSAGVNSIIRTPVFFASPESVHLEENTVVRIGTIIVNSPKEHVYIKKYTVVGLNVVIITNNHRSLVGVPQVILGASQINDFYKDLHIDEDVWVGTNVTILPNGDLGRGCIVGACSTVTKPVPPYALVVGSPAKIVGVKFSIDQIIEHEKALYPESERMSRNQLEDLFSKYYEGMKVYGVQRELTQEELEEIERTKRSRHFIEPNLV